jgi:crotonobetainyl-CoA:carnitine CoA-transferase CaiB-like acyl-CoA transferase
VGRDLDVSLFDTALHNLNYLATWYLARGHRQDRIARSGHPSLTPSQLYRTADGWIFVMCNKEKFWPILCDGIGRPDLASDPRFVDFAARLAHRDTLTEVLDAAFSTRSTAAWMERLGGRAPVAPVNDIAQALANPFVTDERGSIGMTATEDGAEVPLLRGPIRYGGAPALQAGPRLGRDTRAVLAGLGYDAETLDALLARGVVAETAAPPRPGQQEEQTP